MSWALRTDGLGRDQLVPGAPGEGTDATAPRGGTSCWGTGLLAIQEPGAPATPVRGPLVIHHLGGLPHQGLC